MKPEIEFSPCDGLPWEKVGPGLSQQVLSHEVRRDICTRLLKFEPGTSTTEALRHDFWEEVWILTGAITDRRLGKTFKQGMYACRPPGMEHGPWDSPEGCVTFEVRYSSWPRHESP